MRPVLELPEESHAILKERVLGGARDRLCRIVWSWGATAAMRIMSRVTRQLRRDSQNIRIRDPWSKLGCSSGELG